MCVLVVFATNKAFETDLCTCFLGINMQMYYLNLPRTQTLRKLLLPMEVSSVRTCCKQ